MAGKHQFKISAKSTRRKAQRSWRRKAKASLTLSGKVPQKQVIRKQRYKLKKASKRRIGPETVAFSDSGPIGTFADLINQSALKDIIEEKK